MKGFVKMILGWVVYEWAITATGGGGTTTKTGIISSRNGF